MPPGDDAGYKRQGLHHGGGYWGSYETIQLSPCLIIHSFYKYSLRFLKAQARQSTNCCRMSKQEHVLSAAQTCTSVHVLSSR